MIFYYYWLYYFLIFLMVFVAVLSVFLIVQQINLSNIRKRQEKINTQSKLGIQKLDFKQNKVFYLNDYASYNQSELYKKYISVDIENKKICLIDYDKGNLFVINFEEFLNCEIYENGSHQLVGGNIGGLCSGLFSAEANGRCKELKLIIRLNKYDVSQVVYDIVFNTTFNMGINKSSTIYKQCMKSLQEVVSFFEVVKNDNIKK